MKNEVDFYLQHTGDIAISPLSKKDLKNLIQTGEGAFLEFKHKVASPEKIAREIAAFANSGGGTILIGVSDNGDMIGVEGYHEEEFLLNQAAAEECIPAIAITIELLHLGHRDILIVKVPESDMKPVYVKDKKGRKVFVRRDDESVVASDEMAQILTAQTSTDEVTFEFGDNEQQLFRFLNEYGEISVERFSILINKTTYTAAKILVNLVSAGILEMFERDGTELYAFSPKTP
ncbi:MAG: ATP-binding protein [Bacteroidota bacterium]